MRHTPLHRLLYSVVFVLSPLMAQDAQNRNSYAQTNLVSDVSGLATHTDPNLLNSWGIAFIGPGPWWVNAAGTGLSLLYDGQGNPYPHGSQLVVTIPAPPVGGPSVPTGIVSNSSQDFQIGGAHAALFLFASARGTISGWYTGTNAQLVVTKAGAAYTGLTIGQIAGKNMLYAANFAGGVDVYDGSFNPVSLAPGAFQDPMVPAGYAPFNVQNIGGSIWVMWAEVGPNGRAMPGPGLGYVDEFTSDGTLIMALQHGDWMNAPWGITMAPSFGFGPMSKHLLVGQFGSGQIAAFNPSTGKFVELMNGTNGQPVNISGLWGIRFGNGGLAGSGRSLYFAAGINGEADGLFGMLTHQ